jgi:hypothetical protein
MTADIYRACGATPIVPFVMRVAGGGPIAAIAELHDFSNEHRELTCSTCGDVPWPCDTVRLLAIVFADHPDYRNEWRP